MKHKHHVRLLLPHDVFLSCFTLPDMLLVKAADQASATASAETTERREEENPADLNCCNSGSRRNESKGTEQKLHCNNLLFLVFMLSTSYTLTLQHCNCIRKQQLDK
ncbi:hypothetical protein XENOCAPTIV_017132 [Xenoophorus captivus]|uniref:Uncharacterized protein n=1 Tax=Xenoophorus captivus TaxID=1517983 RepID=A0ABV0RKZ4_9TELE